MASGDFKYLPTRRASDKVLFDKTFDNVKNPKHDANSCGIFLMFNKYFDKLHKPNIRLFKNLKYIHSLGKTLGMLI